MDDIYMISGVSSLSNNSNLLLLTDGVSAKGNCNSQKTFEAYLEIESENNISDEYISEQRDYITTENFLRDRVYDPKDTEREMDFLKNSISARLNMEVTGIRVRNLGEFTLDTDDVVNSLMDNMTIEEMRSLAGFVPSGKIVDPQTQNTASPLEKLKKITSDVAERTGNSTLSRFNSWLDVYEGQLAWEEENGGFDLHFYEELSKSKMFGDVYTPDVDLSKVYTESWLNKKYTSRLIESYNL